MNLLALPTPSFPGSSKSFIHNGYLPDVAYRTPWTRGGMTSKHYIQGHNEATFLHIFEYIRKALVQNHYI